MSEDAQLPLAAQRILDLLGNYPEAGSGAGDDVGGPIIKDHPLYSSIGDIFAHFPARNPILRAWKSVKTRSRRVSKWDDDGKPIESAILEPTAFAPPIRKPVLNKKDRLALQALVDAIDSTGQPATVSHIKTHPELSGKKYVLLDTWRKGAYPALDTGSIQQASIRQAFVRSKEKLVKEEKILLIDDCSNSHY